MLAYAANRPDPAGRRSSPNTMLFIIAAHVAGIAALMAWKMDLPAREADPPIIVTMPRDPTPPPPNDETKATKPTPQPSNEWLTHPKPQVPTDPIKQDPVDLSGTTTFDPGPIVGPTVDPIPLPRPIPRPVTVEPRLLTPPSQLRPPYPEAKLANEEEAVLHLRLAIGADGRVTSVEPVGRADPVFLQAARRHLIAHWRYSPATVDGRAVATTTVITLSFQLDA
ncbi:periplasmic protein TonB [Sphingomonas sp. F9_3S_D5_B_2]